MPLTRRTLLQQTATLAGATLSLGAIARHALALAQPTAAAPARLTLHPGQVLATIPSNFVGLGYEISSVTRPGVFGPTGPYVDLVRALAPHGVIRIGGNTADFATFSPDGASVSSPKGTVVTQPDLLRLRAFLDATGWQLLWSVNLGAGITQANIDAAVDEAVAISRTFGPRLLALEIGNEPDLFFIEHRPKPYPYEQFHSEYDLFRDALLRRLPDLPLAGPDAAVANAWVRRFALDEGQAELQTRIAAEPRNLRLLTQHYYREGQNPTSTLDKLLRPDPRLPAALAELRSVSRSSGLPYRICEVNSFSGGGRPGVSNTFASALWVLDYMFLLAQNGCSGVNLETGVNQLGFVSSYSPIFENPDGTLTARPEYDGIAAFAQATGIAGPGAQALAGTAPVDLIASDLDAGAANVTAYALQHAPGRFTAILINKDPATDLAVHIRAGDRPFASAARWDLTAPALDATAGVTLAAQTSSGAEPRASGLAHEGQTGATLHLPRSSAALVHLVL